MLEEGDAVAPRGEARVAEVPARLGQHLPERKLETVLPVHVAGDGEVRSVGVPVGLAHSLRDLARRAALERHSRERAREDAVPQIARPGQDRELSLRGDREQLHAGLAGRNGAGIVRPQRKDLGSVARRRGAVDDGLAVGGEAGVEDRVLEERELRVGEGRGLGQRRTCGGPAGSRRPARRGRSRERRRSRDGGRRTAAGARRRGRGSSGCARSPRRRRATRGRRRGRAPSGTAARDSSRGSGGRCARGRARRSGW